MILQRPRLSTGQTVAIAAMLMLWAAGALAVLLRLFLGLGATTNLSDATPWGLWIGFDVMCGVALAAGGFVTAASVYVFGREKYRPILRPAILTAFLGYLLVIFGLIAGHWPAVAHLAPVGDVEHALRHARGGLVRDVLYDSSGHRVQPGGLRTPGLEEAAQGCALHHPGCRHPGGHPLDPAPVVAWVVVPDRCQGRSTRCGTRPCYRCSSSSPLLRLAWP